MKIRAYKIFRVHDALNEKPKEIKFVRDFEVQERPQVGFEYHDDHGWACKVSRLSYNIDTDMWEILFEDTLINYAQAHNFTPDALKAKVGSFIADNVKVGWQVHSSTIKEVILEGKDEPHETTEKG